MLVANLGSERCDVGRLHDHDKIVVPEREVMDVDRCMAAQGKALALCILAGPGICREAVPTVKATGGRVSAKAPGIGLRQRTSANVATADENQTSTVIRPCGCELPIDSYLCQAPIGEETNKSLSRAKPLVHQPVQR